jgi:homoserine kinase
LYCVIIYTDIEISTKDARRVLPECVPLKDAVKHWGNSAALTAGLFKNDLKLIGRAVEDFIVEPVRASLIPNYYKIKEIAYKNGSLACNISEAVLQYLHLPNQKNLRIKLNMLLMNLW